MRKYPKRKYTDDQREWCQQYEHQTTFEPLMCDYEAGNESFIEAAQKSVHWFESWSSDAYLRISERIPGYAESLGLDAV